MITLSSFFKCSATYRGGGICTYDTNEIYITKTCFLECSAQYCPGMELWGDIYTINIIQINFTDYNNPAICKHASFMVSYKLNFFSLNISNTRSNQFSSGIYIGNNENKEIGKYCQFFNNNGPSFMGIRSKNDGISFSISNFSFINNSVTSSWFEIHAKSSTLTIYNSFFSKLSYKTIFIKAYTSSGQINFQNCYFNLTYDTNFFSDISLSINYFNYYDNNNKLDLLNTKYCWENFTEINSLNFKKLNYFSNFLFIFLFLELE